jgi:hypothetical protein
MDPLCLRNLGSYRGTEGREGYAREPQLKRNFGEYRGFRFPLVFILHNC